MKTTNNTNETKANFRARTPDDENDAIRAQVEREFPRPAGGFESSDQEDEWRERVEARFIELVQDAAPGLGRLTKN